MNPSEDLADSVVGPRYDRGCQADLEALKDEYVDGALTFEEFDQAVTDRLNLSDKMLHQLVHDPLAPGGVREDRGIPTTEP